MSEYEVGQTRKPIRIGTTWPDARRRSQYKKQREIGKGKLTKTFPIF